MPLISSIYLKITNRCNLRCGHCYIKNYSGDMSEETVKQVARKYPTGLVIFHGGEPTIMGVDYLRRAIDILGERDYHLQSNLIEVEDGLSPLLNEYFKGEVGTSLDKARFVHMDTWLRNVSLLSGKGIKVRTIVTVTHDVSGVELADALGRFEIAGGESFTLQPVTPIRGVHVNASLYETIFETLLDHPLNRTAEKFQNALCSGAGDILGGNCAKKVRTIDPDGTVYVCPDFAGQGLFPLGHISRMNNGGIFRPGCRVYFAREKRLAEECCELWRACKGGCLASAYFAKANALYKDPYCESYRRFFKLVSQRPVHAY